MLHLIEKLQRAPEETRRLALYVALAVFMSVVVVVWMQTFDTRFGGAPEESTGPSPLTVFKEEGSRLWQQAQERLGG